MTKFVKISELVTHTQEKNVKTVGQSFTAQVVVLQMLSMQVVQFVVSINQVVNYSKRVWNVQL